MGSSSAPAAVTKYHTWVGGCGGYKQHFFLTVLETGSPWSRCTDSASGESLLPSSQMAVFSMCPHVAEGARELCGVSFIRALIPCMRALPSWTKHLQIPSHRELGFNMWIGGASKGINIQFRGRKGVWGRLELSVRSPFILWFLKLWILWKIFFN